MTQGLATNGRSLAKKGIFVQLIVAFLLCVSVLLFQPQLSLAVFLGCLSFILPHTIFSYWVFRYAGATRNNVVAESFNQGMKIKLILTCVIYVVAFHHFHVHAAPLLSAYVTVMVSQWLAMFLLD